MEKQKAGGDRTKVEAGPETLFIQIPNRLLYLIYLLTQVKLGGRPFEDLDDNGRRLVW